MIVATSALFYNVVYKKHFFKNILRFLLLVRSVCVLCVYAYTLKNS